jgi:hypothetical protein
MKVTWTLENKLAKALGEVMETVEEDEERYPAGKKADSF